MHLVADGCFIVSKDVAPPIVAACRVGVTLAIASHVPADPLWLT